MRQQPSFSTLHQGWLSLTPANSIFRGPMRRECIIRLLERAIPMLQRLAVYSVWVAFAGCVWMSAQNVVLNGALSGRLTDRSGAAVSGATVVAQSLATGMKV